MPTPHALFPADYDVAYTYYFPILFRFAVKHLNDSEIAKDLAQETLIQFWKKRKPTVNQKMVHDQKCKTGFSNYRNVNGTSRNRCFIVQKLIP